MPLLKRAVPLAMCAALLGGLGACGGSEPQPVPAQVSLNTATVALTALGQQQQLSASITDQDGNTLPPETASWSSSNPGVASVSQTGLVTALAPGSTQVTASAGSVSAAAQVSVAQAPAEIQKVSGDNQTAPAGATLTSPLVVQVNDAGDNPIPNATVMFTVAQGDGSVGSSSVVTGADGRAATTYTTSSISGSPQVIAATVPSTPLSVTFSAVAAADPSSFNIGIRFLGTATEAQRQAFNSARLRWEEAVTGDLEDGLLQVPAASCGTDSPAVNQEIDDVLILVRLVPIDGEGGVLGGAGPCYVRDAAPLNTVEVGDLTILGSMQFDTDDLEALEAQGILSNVVLHEMGHVLGVGTLWEVQNFLTGPSLPDNDADPSTPNGDPHFNGSQGISAFDDVGGVTYIGGAKVPVENSGGPGTADSHWREDVLGNELMTGYIATGSSPLSVVTLASLADQGYGVDFTKADPFTLLTAVRAFSSQPLIHLKNDVLRLPIRKVDSRGRVTGELRR
jgi:hypothetical protein